MLAFLPSVRFADPSALCSDKLSFSLVGDNKIKCINGGAFLKLKKLTGVHLRRNVCISEFFNDPIRIATMPQIVTEKSGFDENADQIFELQTFINKTILDKEICHSEMIALNLSKKNEISKLNAELDAENLKVQSEKKHERNAGSMRQLVCVVQRLER